MPVDPTILTGASGPDWSVGGIGSGAGDVAGAEGAGGTGSSFGAMLGDQLGQLEKLQNTAADASRSLADGTASDPATAVVAVERAQLAMQLASQLRTKGVEALQELLHTQV
jgi:flagellar hook-basal body complex protein FliE